MKKWLAIIMIVLSLGLTAPVSIDLAQAVDLRQQMQQNQRQLLHLWLQEEASLISQLLEIDRRLQFRMPRQTAIMLMDAKNQRLQRLAFVRAQITNLSMQLYGRPRP